MASSSFRDSLNSMGWSRRDPDIPVNTSSKPLLSRLQGLNPFGDQGYVRLPTTSNEAPGAPLPAPTRREEEEGFFARKSIRIPYPHGSRKYEWDQQRPWPAVFVTYARIMHCPVEDTVDIIRRSDC